jgi:hypothetical protein
MLYWSWQARSQDAFLSQTLSSNARALEISDALSTYIATWHGFRNVSLVHTANTTFTAQGNVSMNAFNTSGLLSNVTNVSGKLGGAFAFSNVEAGFLLANASTPLSRFMVNATHLEMRHLIFASLLAINITVTTPRNTTFTDSFVDDGGTNPLLIFRIVSGNNTHTISKRLSATSANELANITDHLGGKIDIRFGEYTANATLRINATSANLSMTDLQLVYNRDALRAYVLVNTTLNSSYLSRSGYLPWVQ